MTRRDFIKFVFVRNPFYRALSLYLDVYKFTSGSQKKDNYAMALARGSANWVRNRGSSEPQTLDPVSPISESRM